MGWSPWCPRTHNNRHLAPSNATTAIDKVLADAVARGDMPGVVAMVTDRRGIVYQGAFGVADAGSGSPMTVDTIFRIASMTKPITSLAVMQLVEQGRLSLDDPAENYLPQLANLKVFDTFDARTGAYTFGRPASADRAAYAHSHGRARLRLHESDRARLQAASGRNVCRGTAALRPRRAMALQHRHRLGRPHRRERCRARISSRISAITSSARWGWPIRPTTRRTIASAATDCRAPPPPGRHFRGRSGSAADVGGTAHRRRRACVDGVRLHPLPADAAQSGTLNGARIVSPETVATMGRNHIGRVGVRAVKTAMPERSSDFTFVDDGRDKWGIGFMITADGKPGRRSAGSLSWGGINNTYFWIDPARGIAGVILMQFLPFADSKALAVYDAFERAVYELK